jgi:hypothetical protein
LFHFAIEIICFRQQIFAPIGCDQDQRAVVGQLKRVEDVHMLMREINNVHSCTTFPRMTQVGSLYSGHQARCWSVTD